MYCNTSIVLQAIVSYDCIARGLAEDKLYCNTMDCIVTKAGQCCIAIQPL